MRYGRFEYQNFEGSRILVDLITKHSVISNKFFAKDATLAMF